MASNVHAAYIVNDKALRMQCTLELIRLRSFGCAILKNGRHADCLITGYKN
jgi:hypothetical protein